MPEFSKQLVTSIAVLQHQVQRKALTVLYEDGTHSINALANKLGLANNPKMFWGKINALRKVRLVDYKKDEREIVIGIELSQTGFEFVQTMLVFQRMLEK